MADTFYILSKATVKKVREILSWAHKNGLSTDVDKLDCSVSICRTKADKTFEEALKLVNYRTIGFLRIIFRKQMNPWGIVSESSERIDLLEVFIRSIDVGQIEYFIFIYLEPSKLAYLKKKYTLIEL